eukprot:gnl/MRDRNA2_/MRDRNA2_31163_c0_seq1.p1 gnl/MRDRNA2_/MRDRNA2_31163_c0~~gnl/MRDRNA2_/MRDRNA2_31163_c0_seq1.p1  ORF type:complete len:333 (-),score=52.98 gnl/MRDRNA2_/MRDRNA2_31163_c0_seq1:42-1040(-)
MITPNPAPVQYGLSKQHLVEMGRPQQQTMEDCGMRILQNSHRVRIEEKVNVLEAAVENLFGFELEMANKYVIKTEEGHPIFLAVEKTNVCNRQCGGDCRAVDVDVAIIGQDSALSEEAGSTVDWNFNPIQHVDSSESQVFIKLRKDFQCTLCCFNRPEVRVMSVASGKLLGIIKHPWNFCDMTFSISDHFEQELLRARAGCCQSGILCPCPLGPCSEVSFSVTDPASGRELASLRKQVPGCLKYCFAQDVNNYLVEFDKIEDPTQRALMVALALFIDFRYFNSTAEKTSAGECNMENGGTIGLANTALQEDAESDVFCEDDWLLEDGVDYKI